MYSSLAFTSCNLRHRIDCRAPARLVLLGLLVLVPTWQLNAAGLEQAGAQSSQSIMESIAQNWNTSEDLQIEELTRVLDVAHGLLTAQPGLPRHVAELRAGGASAFLVFLMMNHTTISREDVQSWATTVSTFLRQHAGQMWESGHSSLAAGGETTHRKRMAMAAGADGGSDSSHGVFGLTARDQAGLTGLPLVRRVLIAKLLLSWMGPWGRQLPEGAEHLIQDIVKQLYGIHVASVTRRGMVEFMHISKSGGTSFSDVARKNGCPMWPRADGNLEGLDDECRWLNVTALKQRTGKQGSSWARYGLVERRTRVHGCAARAAYVMAKEFRYISNEYTLHGGMHKMGDTHLCPQFVNVVMLREPSERLESHLRYMLLYWAGKDRLERPIRAGGPQLGQLMCSNWRDPSWEAGVWHDICPPVADNYMTRTFLGEPAFHSPVGAISSEHVALARALLLQFDMVLDLNAGHAVGDTLLQQGLGWATTLAEVRARTSAKIGKKSGNDVDFCVPAGQDEVLGEGKQMPDKELYRFGAALNRLDLFFYEVARMQGLKPATVAKNTVSRTELESSQLGADQQLSENCGLVGYLDPSAAVAARKTKRRAGSSSAL